MLCVLVVLHIMQRWKSGTTCVCAFIREQQLTIGWAGDSQAVLVRKGKAVPVMFPHKPDRPVSDCEPLHTPGRYMGLQTACVHVCMRVCHKNCWILGRRDEGGKNCEGAN